MRYSTAACVAVVVLGVAAGWWVQQRTIQQAQLREGVLRATIDGQQHTIDTLAVQASQMQAQLAEQMVHERLDSIRYIAALNHVRVTGLGQVEVRTDSVDRWHPYVVPIQVTERLVADSARVASLEAALKAALAYGDSEHRLRVAVQYRADSVWALYKLATTTRKAGGGLKGFVAGAVVGVTSVVVLRALLH